MRSPGWSAASRAVSWTRCTVAACTPSGTNSTCCSPARRRSGPPTPAPCGCARSAPTTRWAEARSDQDRGLARGGRCLLQKDLLGLPVPTVRICRAVADRSQPDPPVLGDGADHVQDDAGLARLVEVQPVPCHHVEEVVDAEPPQRG